MVNSTEQFYPLQSSPKVCRVRFADVSPKLDDLTGQFDLRIQDYDNGVMDRTGRLQIFGLTNKATISTIVLSQVVNLIYVAILSSIKTNL